MATTLEERGAILDRSRRRRAAAAERAMRRRLDVVIERLVGFERRHPDFLAAERW